MKKILLIALLTTSIFSCDNKKKESDKNNADQVLASEQKEKIEKKLYGFWVGNFELANRKAEYEGDLPEHEDKLNIIIKKIERDSVFGESVVSGNKRSLKGTLSYLENGIKFILNEPGDNKFDGKFEFESTLNGNLITGTWTPFNMAAKRPARKYKLLKQAFVYNPNLMFEDQDFSKIDWYTSKNIKVQDTVDGKIEKWTDVAYRVSSKEVYKINASNKALNEDSLKNLLKLDLEIIKNSIYARHGYAFKNKIYRQFFDHVNWYVPVSNNIDHDLTSLENNNIKILDRFIKYAEDNYQTFGR